jgi:hypothetical protein
VHEVFPNGTIAEIKNLTKFMPRLMKNSNSTIVKSYFDLKVNFSESTELTKVYQVKNLGFIKERRVRPANETGPVPWNYNLPQFKQINHWDIYNYPSNYQALKPGKSIVAGNKKLTFNRIQKKKMGAGSDKPTASLVQVKSTFQDDQKAQQSLLISNSSKKAAKKLKKQNQNEGAAVFTLNDNSTGLSQQFAFNLRYYVGAF